MYSLLGRISEEEQLRRYNVLVGDINEQIQEIVKSIEPKHISACDYLLTSSAYGSLSAWEFTLGKESEVVLLSAEGYLLFPKLDNPKLLVVVSEPLKEIKNLDECIPNSKNFIDPNCNYFTGSHEYLFMIYYQLKEFYKRILSTNNADKYQICE